VFLTTFFLQYAGTISVLFLFGSTCHPQHLPPLDYRSLFCFVPLPLNFPDTEKDTEKQHKKPLETAVLKPSD